MGRSCIDLYSNDIGAPFEEITGFSAFVGGCPTNISTAARRLGVKSSLFTGVGEDPVGDFILHFLDNEGIDRRYTVRKPGKALLISGTGLSLDPSRSATAYAAEVASENGVAVFLDVDFRADQWPDVQTFGAAVRSVLPSVDYVIGTDTEIKAAAYKGSGKAEIEHSQVNESTVEADLLESIHTLLGKGPKRLFQKSGTDGCFIFEQGGGEKIHVPGFPVEVVNTLGAGDGFAGGLMYGFLNGWEWYKAARFANACGAYLVTQHGCANFMPTQDDIQTFLNNHGGL
ncbi:MAG: 5-dehydro-2-deoxygluconokinase [Bacteroidetes bacterium]|nr:5-dehydro-2-deoxygluconokinase [Bacteroidota bacterium]